jgi:hypothetical protein
MSSVPDSISLEEGSAGADLRRAAGAMLAGGLLAAVAEVACGFVLDSIARRGASPTYALGFRAFLNAGGWLWVPLWGAALAGFRAAAWASRTRGCATILAVAMALAALPIVLRPAVDREHATGMPVTAREKTRALLKWSYRSPETVARILDLSHDPDPDVREHAVLSMGVNLIVSDVERGTDFRPARYASHPLRGRLKTRLLELMSGDSVEAVRGEAARALWKAPVAFGRQPAAAETLAAMLGRAQHPGGTDRIAWLALDATAAVPDRGLKLAAARFAAVVPDSDLATAARAAAAGAH